jgi:hypothetical protein
MRHFADNVIYLSQQEYQITVIDKNPDSDVADRIEKYFQIVLLINTLQLIT